MAKTVVAALSAVGLIGAVAYLQSLAHEPFAIPLGGVGVLALSPVGMTVTIEGDRYGRRLVGTDERHRRVAVFPTGCAVQDRHAKGDR